MSKFTPHDFAATWQAYRDTRYGNQTEADDRALWESFATQYDDRAPLCPGVMGILESLIQPGDTVLDVGAGTGRYALPLARLAQSVTALDPSPAMMAQLREKMQAQAITNINFLETTLEDATLEPHDVVLAAWSLYRQQDITARLRQLTQATRRTLVIVDGDSGLFLPDERPHEQIRAKVWNRGPGIPNYLYFAGMLWQIGARADVRVVYDERACQGATPREVAAQITPAMATPEQIDRYTAELEPILTHTDGVYHYRSTNPIGVVIWNRPQSPDA